MPIKQERMLALIAAGQDWRQAFERAQREARELEQDLQAGRISASAAFTTLASFVSSALLTDPVQSAITLELEQRHFQRRGKANELDRARQREKRGVPEPKAEGTPNVLLPELDSETAAELERWRGGGRAGLKLELEDGK